MTFKHAGILIVMSAGLGPSKSVWAQRVDQRAVGQPLINDLQAEFIMLPANGEPQRDVLVREVQFMTKVCELSPDESETLLAAGQQLAANRAHRMVTRVRVVNGRAVVEAESPSAAMRRDLTPLLKAVSHTAWERFDAERERLDLCHKRAAIFASVAELDEAVLLSSEQRRKLCELLTSRGDAWWLPSIAKAALLPGEQTQDALIASGNLGGFGVPSVELEAILRPWQMARYDELQRPATEELAQQVAGQARRARLPAAAVRVPIVPVPLLPAPQAPPGMAPPAPKAVPAAGFAPAAGIVQAPQMLQRRIVRRSPTPEEQRRSLDANLGRLVEDLDVSCGLTEIQRQKLLLAGRLDINDHFDRAAPSDKLPDDQRMLIEAVRVSLAVSRMPGALFGAADSAYQKALRNQLFDEQRQKLAAVERARYEFRRQALIEVVVVGFARAAALTSTQCDALSGILHDVLGTSRDEAKTNWRAECLRRIVEIPEANFNALFFDFQWAGAKRQQAQLAQAAAQLEAQPVAGARIRVVDPQGGIIEFDALQMDVKP
jgi:hypothetical protein